MAKKPKTDDERAMLTEKYWKNLDTEIDSYAAAIDDLLMNMPLKILRKMVEDLEV